MFKRRRRKGECNCCRAAAFRRDLCLDAYIREASISICLRENKCSLHIAILTNKQIQTECFMFKMILNLCITSYANYVMRARRDCLSELDVEPAAQGCTETEETWPQTFPQHMGVVVSFASLQRCIDNLKNSCSIEGMQEKLACYC